MTFKASGPIVLLVLLMANGFLVRIAAAQSRIGIKASRRQPYVSRGRRRVAQMAGVKTLVLSHFVPPDDPVITDEMWIDAARMHFRGPVVVGKDLLEL